MRINFVKYPDGFHRLKDKRYMHTYFIYLYTVKSSVKKNNNNKSNTVLQDCRVGARLINYSIVSAQ